MTLRPARLLGLGAAQPDAVSTADELGAAFGRTGDWVTSRTGITELRRIDTGDTLPALAVSAAREALAMAGIVGDSIDLVITASCSRRTEAGPLAPAVAGELAPRAARFELNAACAGFCYSLAAAQSLIGTGAAERVLVVGAEHMSDLVDPADLGTSIIFGDGAGAAVLGATDAGDALSAPAWGSDGAQAGVIDMTEDGKFLHMQGSAVFRWAVEEMHTVAQAALARAGVTIGDIDVFVPHQANARIVEGISKRLGITSALVADDVRISGNTSAASIPIALTKLLRAGRAHSGQLALLVGFGAGLCYAGQVVRLP